MNIQRKVVIFSPDGKDYKLVKISSVDLSKKFKRGVCSTSQNMADLPVGDITYVFSWGNSHCCKCAKNPRINQVTTEDKPVCGPLAAEKYIYGLRVDCTKDDAINIAKMFFH